MSPLDEAIDTTSEISIACWHTKTAPTVNGKTNLWSYITCQPIRVAFIRKGLRLTLTEAKVIAAACCLIEALREIRLRMLPAIKSTLRPHTHKQVKVYALRFFPQAAQKFTEGKEVRFYEPNTFNPRIKDMHAEMVARYHGFPELARGQQARHYRHVALTSFYILGCSDYAKQRHAPKSAEFERSYRIDELHPDFIERFNAVKGLTKFAQLTAPERMLL